MFSIRQIDGVLAETPVLRTSASGIPYRALRLVRISSPAVEGADALHVEVTVLCWRRLAERVAHLRAGDIIHTRCHDSLSIEISNGTAAITVSARNVSVASPPADTASSPGHHASDRTDGQAESGASRALAEPINFLPAAPATPVAA